MKHRIAMLAIAVLPILGTGAAAVGPAQAATAGPVRAVSPDALTGPFALVLSGTDNCIVTNGVGDQLTDANFGSNSCAQITFAADGSVIIGSNSYPVYTWRDANDHCIKASEDDKVYPDSEGCHPIQDEAEDWVVTSCVKDSSGDCKIGAGNPFRFENLALELWLMTTGGASGDRVWVNTGGFNDWELE